MMTRKTMRVMGAAIVVVGAALFVCSTDAGAGFPKLKLFGQTGCGLCCPACNHVCNLSAEVVDAEKSCFDVECKVICIPKVVFPWQKKKAHGACDTCDGQGCNACVHNCGRTRTVRVLTTKKYKCPECEYTWTAEPAACVGCDTGCDSGSASTPYSSQPMVYREFSESAAQPAAPQSPTAPEPTPGLPPQSPSLPPQTPTPEPLPVPVQ